MGVVAGYPKKITKNVSKGIIEEVAAAKLKLKHGQDYRKQKRELIWKRNERQYEGNHWNVEDVGQLAQQDLIVINMSFSTVNTIVPYMTGSDPDFLVFPYSGDATARNAAVQAALLNNMWRSAGISGQSEMETVSVDFLVYGDGYAKTGYTIEEKRTSQATYDDVASLWVDRVSPWDVWMDPSADGIHNARWVAQRLRVTRTELEANKAYTNKDEMNISYGTHDQYDKEAEEGEKFTREVFDGTEYATLYEFYDLVNMRKLVFSETGDRPLQYVEDIGECPITQMGNYRLTGSPYHMGELEQLWPLQYELNKTRSHLIQHRRRNAQKFAYRKGTLGPDAIKALESSEVNIAIEVDDDRPLQDVVTALQVPAVSGDVYNVSELMQRDIYEISGVNEYLRGATPEIRRTATEASIIEGASNIKSQFKLRQIEKAVKNIGRLMLGFAKDIFPQTNFDEVQLFLTGREAERVAKADGEEYDPSIPMSVSPAPGIFVGEYEVDVTQSSTELRNPIIREQKYKGILDVLVNAFPTLQAAGVIPNLKRVMELWFEAAGIEDVDEMFITQAPLLPPEADPTAEAGAEGGVEQLLTGMGGELAPGSDQMLAGMAELLPPV